MLALSLFMARGGGGGGGGICSCENRKSIKDYYMLSGVCVCVCVSVRVLARS